MMKVNNTNMQVYSNAINQRQPVPPQAEAKAAEPNQFSQARFADLLSLQEKRYIAQNFKPESSANKPSHLGKVIDVRA